MAIMRIHAVVEGRVQGVYFRAFTAEEANRLCLSGWVRNLADGSVETEFQGGEAEVGRMVDWLHQGSPMSRVSRVRTNPCQVVEEEKGFVVRY